jgi:hypothetical protein
MYIDEEVGFALLFSNAYREVFHLLTAWRWEVHIPVYEGEEEHESLD